MDNPAEEQSKIEQFESPEPFTVEIEGAELKFFPSGSDRLNAVLELIASAKTRLRLYYYIFNKDEAGARVRDALAEAAARGVVVTMVLDDFGAMADAQFLSSITERGGKVLRFSPRWNVRYLIRNHQKLLIADDEIALVGGFNIEDAYFAPPEEGGWNDLGLTIRGKGVDALVEWFCQLEDWTEDPKAQFRSFCRLVREWEPGDSKVRWLVGGPTRGLSSWARSVLHDIECGNRLDMMMAYFSPRGGIVKRIGKIAQRGAATLLLASKTDILATLYAARSLYGRMLRRGVKIGEFLPSPLHTKLIVIDDVTYIGSANFDMRSLYINLELMVRIEDARLADRMREFIAYHMRFSTHVTPEVHRKRRGLWARLRGKISWFIVAVLDYTLTRRLNIAPPPP